MRGKTKSAAIPAAILLSLLWAGTPSQAQETAPSTLKLGEILALARERNPRLRAARLQVDATRSREAEAGLLPDPTLMVGVANLALPEFSASMPASMAPSIQATQRFPLAGKRGLREKIARQSTEIDDMTAEEVWWTVRTQVVSAFYEIYRTDRQTQVLRRTLGLIQNFQTVALSMYSSGTGPQADVLQAGVARARMEADIHRLLALRRGAASRLNGFLNRSGDTPIPSPELAPMPAEVPSVGALSQWAVESRPALLAMRLAITRAESNRELAGKAIWPDLTLGLQYALGRMDGDPASMGGASIGFSLPIYAGSRQRKLKEEATALEGMAKAQFEDALASVNAALGESMAELDRGRTLIHLYTEDILPQARAAVESSLSSYRVGGVDFMALIDAQMAVNRFEGEYFDLIASYGFALAQLEQTVGRDLPASADSIQEIR
jgi:cobalt-zinc-cadmium efflux system outer membrane protein